MKALYHQRGAQMDIHILEQDEAQSFIETHAHILDSTFQKVEMTDKMRQRLTRSNYIFSGLKTFHELNEAFPSLLDENGDRKPFERFLNDVRKIDETYNRNYLRAEYGFVQASANMAAKWEQYSEDGDRYLLQYRTQHDDKVRPEHAALDRITLPMTDPFWESYYPPNGWNCRCTVVQVRRGKYQETPHREAMDRGDEALNGERYNIFRFNSGKQEKTVPSYNPYTIRRCNDCNVAKGGSVKLADFSPDSQLCQACQLLHQCAADRTKTQRAIERKHYVDREMRPLLRHSKIMPTEDDHIKVGFTQYGNKHLFSDTFGRSSILTKDDLASLNRLLDNATFIESASLSHPRRDGIQRFYYYKASIREHDVRLNVAKQVYSRPNGQNEVRYFLYSINDI